MKKLWSKLTAKLPPLGWFRSPRDVDPGTWLFFPHRPELRHCGIAGILEVVERQEEVHIDLNQVDADRNTILNSNFTTLLQDGKESQNWKDVSRAIDQMDDVTESWKRFSAQKIIITKRDIRDKIGELQASLARFIEEQEEEVFGGTTTLASSQIEDVNSLLMTLKDIAWRLDREILANVDSIGGLTTEGLHSSKQILELRKLNSMLNNIDRLEIRGRDSAGFSTFVTFPDSESLDQFVSSLQDKGFSDEWSSRRALRDFVHRSIAVHQHQNRPPSVCFVFKLAREIGKLGDNVNHLRQMVKEDEIFHLALNREEASTTSLAHTRWASNGIINVPNCHPVDNSVGFAEGSTTRYALAPFDEPHPVYGNAVGHLNVVLNGDIDNFLTLKDSFSQETGHHISPNITTDAKIIPLQIDRYLRGGHNLQEAFRRSVLEFTGSAAIGLHSDLEPGKIFLSLKGSGQSIYIGLGPDNYCFASEIYGVVEESSHYLKLDGEDRSDPDDPNSHGQVFILDKNSAGGVEGITAMYHDGTAIDVTEDLVKKAEITTRDIDRRGFDHFFIKEIFESPESVIKTMRGKYNLVDQNKVNFNLGGEILPQAIAEKLSSGHIKRIFVTGQGTASIAGMAIAAFIHEDLGPSDIQVRGIQASELSGTYLVDDMSDTLVIAVTQSGTTTDTNHAVEKVQQRGAATLAIVNRRNSDITYKVDGVFYTSDGRDIEMSVASTKAFYSQVIAGNILSLKIAQIMGSRKDEEIFGDLEDLQQLPKLMRNVLSQKDKLRDSAYKYAPTRKYWAVVGSGLNHISAKEVRIKLSELCYKSIACDFVEDKKHIDLSSEPLIIVCAAGSHPSVLGDIVKDVSIFKAHKAIPIVFASEGEERFNEYTYSVFHVPRASKKLSLILNTLAGHLWGYYAAQSMHNEAQFIAQIRSTIVEDISSKDEIHGGLGYETMQKLEELSKTFHQKKRSGVYESSMGTATCSDLALLLKYATNKLPLIDFHSEFDITPTGKNVLEQLLKVLSQAIDELTRPIDAIKHQAKTVTVGTSRLELPAGPLFEVADEVEVGLEEIELPNLNALKQIQPALTGVKGYTLYSISNLDERGNPTDDTTISLEQRSGEAQSIESRVRQSSPLRGTKRSVVSNRRVLVTIGKRDDREIILLPLLGRNFQIAGILLYHIDFRREMPVREKIQALGKKYEQIKNHFTEARLHWKDSLLDQIPVRELFTKPSDDVAEILLAAEIGDDEGPGPDKSPGEAVANPPQMEEKSSEKTTEETGE